MTPPLLGMRPILGFAPLPSGCNSNLHRLYRRTRIKDGQNAFEIAFGSRGRKRQTEHVYGSQEVESSEVIFTSRTTKFRIRVMHPLSWKGKG